MTPDCHTRKRFVNYSSALLTIIAAGGYSAASAAGAFVEISDNFLPFAKAEGIIPSFGKAA